MSVFSAANALSKRDVYEIATLSSGGGIVASGAGLGIQTRALSSVECDSRSTILVVGANMPELEQASMDKTLSQWLFSQAERSERFGSICTGTFLLQSSGLLSDTTVTTHWAGCETLQAMMDEQTVLRDALYHIDGKCWTSAGVTTGIDMALEMLKKDHGQALMNSVAKYLVIYTQRPGKQSQFAQIQDMRPNEEDNFADLIAWLRERLLQPIKVSAMADFMCMSERSFQRKFSAKFSISPSRFFERMRMEYARDFLLPKQTIEQSAHSLGYRSVAAFRTCFEKHFGLSPSTYQKLR